MEQNIPVGRQPGRATWLSKAQRCPFGFRSQVWQFILWFPSVTSVSVLPSPVELNRETYPEFVNQSCVSCELLVNTTPNIYFPSWQSFSLRRESFIRSLLLLSWKHVFLSLCAPTCFIALHVDSNYVFNWHIPFRWPIATAMSIALNPESDSVVGSAPLSGKHTKT